jgi:hypothetical protein
VPRRAAPPERVVSELPALRDALVAAGTRRLRRRRRRVLRVVPPVLAAGAAATVLLLAGRGPADREEPAVTPAPAGDLIARNFAVFRRARTAADALPAGYRLGALAVPADSRGTVRLSAGRSRLTGRGQGFRVWLVPATQGGSARLCALTQRGGADLRGVCAPVAAAIRADNPIRELVRPRLLLLVLPDGTRDVLVTLTDGRVFAPLPIDVRDAAGDQLPSPAPRDNTVLASLPGNPANESWTSATGVRRVDIQALVPPARLPRVEGCPSLGPLPADAAAQARAVALRSVATLYQGVVEARVVSVARPAGTPCRASAAARSLAVGLSLVQADPAARNSASLAQGRLLLGMVNGRMAVWNVQH